MKQYVGVISVSFNVDARDKEDLTERIMKQLGDDLTLEDIEIDSIYSEGGAYDYEDIFHDEMKMGDLDR